MGPGVQIDLLGLCHGPAQDLEEHAQIALSSASGRRQVLKRGVIVIEGHQQSKPASTHSFYEPQRVVEM